MSTKSMLLGIRIFCVVQFGLVFFFLRAGGITRPEMLMLVLSAVFGLFCDGFCQTMVKKTAVELEKAELDEEFMQLVEEMDESVHKKTDV